MPVLAKGREDSIMLRVQDGKCPICNKMIMKGEETIKLDYKNITVVVHKWHEKGAIMESEK